MNYVGNPPSISGFSALLKLQQELIPSLSSRIVRFAQRPVVQPRLEASDKCKAGVSRLHAIEVGLDYGQKIAAAPKPVPAKAPIPPPQLRSQTKWTFERKVP
jgi:hypothetical protein